MGGHNKYYFISIWTIRLTFYLCDFDVGDFKISLYLELPQKIIFNLVSDFFS